MPVISGDDSIVVGVDVPDVSELRAFAVDGDRFGHTVFCGDIAVDLCLGPEKTIGLKEEELSELSACLASGLSVINEILAVAKLKKLVVDCRDIQDSAVGEI